MAERPALPGAVGLSHLRVYDSVAPDGLAGGTPHLHTVCTEAYAVIAGAGAVQTLTVTGGFQEVPLAPGDVVWFSPGTVHRLVNHGDLEIFVVMQNAGLPEAGDMVITFEPDVLADAEQYAAAATLPEASRTTRGPGDAARSRRDRAVEGFGRLRAGGAAALDDLFAAAARLVAPHVVHWRDTVVGGPRAAVHETDRQLDALARADHAHLGLASVHRISPSADERRYGCCGTLGVFVDA